MPFCVPILVSDRTSCSGYRAASAVFCRRLVRRSYVAGKYCFTNVLIKQGPFTYCGNLSSVVLCPAGGRNAWAPRQFFLACLRQSQI